MLIIFLFSNFMIFNQLTGTLYKVTREPLELAEYSQNPLFVNQNTGLTVVKPYFYLTKPFVELDVCDTCHQQQKIEYTESPLYQITRTFCACPMQIFINPVIDLASEPLNFEPVTDHDYDPFS